jgi:hypothetical protein
MNKLFFITVSMLAFFLFAQTAQADTMRCERNVISRGDHMGEVLATCGEPIISTHKTIYRSGIPARRFGVLSLSHGYYSDITSSELLHHNRSVVEVPVEIWTYNFGRRYFMREVTFIDSKVTRIKTLGYGH